MPGQELTPEQVTAAVTWWTAVLRAPTFDTLGPTRHDPERRQDNRSVGMAELLATTTAAANPVTDETLALFGAALRRRLTEQAPRGLFVDYGPEGDLHDAAAEVGLPGGRFPWKTSMYFCDGGVQVACGYGAAEVEVLKGTDK